VERAAAPPPEVCDVTEIVRERDGDTVLAILTFKIGEEDGYCYFKRTASAKGEACRLPWVNTPELPTADGVRAKAETTAWLAAHEPLEGVSYGRDEYGRRLVDFRSAGDATALSLAQWLLTEANDGKGWPPYKPRLS
jgi:hypothetical protein